MGDMKKISLALLSFLFLIVGMELKFTVSQAIIISAASLLMGLTIITDNT